MHEDYGETSGLTSGIPQPTYTFESSANRLRKRQVRQFQCCVCFIFLSIIAVAMVMSVAFNLNRYQPDDNSTTNDTDVNFFILIHKIPLPTWNESNPSKTHHEINEDQYKEAVSAGREALRRKEMIEEDTPELEKDSPSYKHQKIVYTSCKARQLGRIGYAEENAAKHLKTISNFHHHTICYNTSIIPDAGNFNITDFDPCRIRKTVCNNQYRSFDGTCNNLKNPSFGVAYKSYRRLLKPAYADGISSPRVSVDGSPLPSARKVSLTVHRPIYKNDPDFTIMLAVFGQFLDHDITATALSQGENGRSIACCTQGIQTLHPECFPVILDPQDPNYKNLNVSCMEFVRSLPAPTCCFGMREQLNQATSYIDASVIYGDSEVSKTLRTFEKGKLKMYTTPDGRELLPPSEDLSDGCNRMAEAAKGRYCFATGDGRANENLHLTSMHLLWARQHNMIVKELNKVNPHWDDEKLFQEGRKITGAQLAHIAYAEFLPILLGEALMEHFELKQNGGEQFYRGYDDGMDATAANVFVAAAFRFAHTLIPSLIRMIDNRSEEFVQLRKMLLDPFELYDNGTMDRALNGAARTSIEANDPYFSNELKQHMFTDGGKTKLCGLDLVSLNIQRGRDHGLPGYTSWRERCGLRRARSFQQLDADVDGDSLARIGGAYKHVDDIDLYTGAISEKPIEGGFLGPTLTCLILDQFVRLKRGDRFWYENPGQFTRKQLKEIRRSSLARIICDNSDGVEEIQAEVMKKATSGNRRKKCEEISRVNFGEWQELKRIPMSDDGISVVTVRN